MKRVATASALDRAAVSPSMTCREAEEDDEQRQHCQGGPDHHRAPVGADQALQVRSASGSV